MKKEVEEKIKNRVKLILKLQYIIDGDEFKNEFPNHFRDNLNSNIITVLITYLINEANKLNYHLSCVYIHSILNELNFFENKYKNAESLQKAKDMDVGYYNIN